MDDLGLEQADHRLGEGVVIGIPDTADRRFDTGLGETLAVSPKSFTSMAVLVAFSPKSFTCSLRTWICD